jgi:hypothetical protein
VWNLLGSYCDDIFGALKIRAVGCIQSGLRLWNGVARKDGCLNTGYLLWSRAHFHLFRFAI